MSITNQLSKVLYSYKDHELSEQKVSSLISSTESQIKIILEGNTYLGFQIFKQWESSEKGLQAVLQNPFILERLEDEQKKVLASAGPNIEQIYSYRYTLNGFAAPRKLVS